MGFCCHDFALISLVSLGPFIVSVSESVSLLLVQLNLEAAAVFPRIRQLLKTNPPHLLLSLLWK